MGDKHLTEDGWNRVAPKGLKDKRLGNALRVYQKLPEDRFEARTKCLDFVIKTARDFKKLAECQPQLKYLDAVIKAAEAAKAEIRKQEEEAEAERKRAEAEAAKQRKDTLHKVNVEGYKDGIFRKATRRKVYKADRELLDAYDKGYAKGLKDSETDIMGEVALPPPPPDE